jgi:hypothetical protein
MFTAERTSRGRAHIMYLKELLVSGVLMASLTSCAGLSSNQPIRLYEGLELEAAQVAHFSVKNGSGVGARFGNIDGQSLDAVFVELLPGRHIFDVTFINTKPYKLNWMHVKFELEVQAGASYHVNTMLLYETNVVGRMASGADTGSLFSAFVDQAVFLWVEAGVTGEILWGHKPTLAEQAPSGTRIYDADWDQGIVQ